MSQVSTTQLKTELDDILERVRDAGERFEVVEDGREVARIVPALSPSMTARVMDAPREVTDEDGRRLSLLIEQTPEEHAERVARLDGLIEEIGRHLPVDGTTFDVTDDLRREL